MLTMLLSRPTSGLKHQSRQNSPDVEGSGGIVVRLEVVEVSCMNADNAAIASHGVGRRDMAVTKGTEAHF